MAISGKLAGVSPRLDGLRVELRDDDVGPGGIMLYEARSIGGMPVAPGSLYVSFENVDQSPDPSDLATDNPYGKFIDSVQFSDQSSLVRISVYERCTHVHFSNPRTGATLHDSVHWGETDQEIIRLVKDHWTAGHELVDAIFHLQS